MHRPMVTPSVFSRNRVASLLLALAALLSLGPMLQGCGDDLVVGGMLIIRTPTTSTAPTATPDPGDEEDI